MIKFFIYLGWLILLAPKKLPDITIDGCLLSNDCEQLLGNVPCVFELWSIGWEFNPPGMLTGIEDSITALPYRVSFLQEVTKATVVERRGWFNYFSFHFTNTMGQISLWTTLTSQWLFTKLNNKRMDQKKFTFHLGLAQIPIFVAT